MLRRRDLPACQFEALRWWHEHSRERTRWSPNNYRLFCPSQLHHIATSCQIHISSPSFPLPLFASSTAGRHRISRLYFTRRLPSNTKISPQNMRNPLPSSLPRRAQIAKAALLSVRSLNFIFSASISAVFITLLSRPAPKPLSPKPEIGVLLSFVCLGSRINKYPC